MEQAGDKGTQTHNRANSQGCLLNRPVLDTLNWAPSTTPYHVGVPRTGVYLRWLRISFLLLPSQLEVPTLRSLHLCPLEVPRDGQDANKISQGQGYHY